MDGEHLFVMVAADADAVVASGPDPLAQLQHDEASDEDLINALADRADWAMSLLYQRYKRQLYSLAYHVVGNQAVAEDLTQEVFLSIWRSASSYTSGMGSVRNWLFSITRYRAIDYIRYKHRHSPAQETDLEEVDLNEDAATPDLWDDTWRTIQASIIRECLVCLLPEQRLTIELVYFRGWTQAEISQRFSTPIGTVKSRMRLGLHHLRKELEKRGIINE